jgi:hypothetical protein
VTKGGASADLVFSELSAARLALCLAGAVATAGNAVGAPLAGLDTTLAADPALGATTISLTSVTTVVAGDFIRIAPAVPTAANSEVVRVLDPGTAGGGNTDVEGSDGAGLALDHANGETVKTVLGTVLASPAHAGDKTIYVDDVTGFVANDIVQIGYIGHLEDRTVVSVGTSGIEGTGTGIVLDQALMRDHAPDEWVIEIAAAGSTTIAWSIGVIPEAAYKDVVLTGALIDGTPVVVTLRKCIATKGPKFTIDRKWVGVPVTLRATGDKATPNVIPFDVVYG